MTPTLQLRLRSLGLEPARGVSDHLSRVLAQPIDELQFSLLAETATHIGVTDEFVRICDYFKAEPGHTPAGFRFEYELDTTVPLEAWTKEMEANIAARAAESV